VDRLIDPATNLGTVRDLETYLYLLRTAPSGPNGLAETARWLLGGDLAPYNGAVADIDPADLRNELARRFAFAVLRRTDDPAIRAWRWRIRLRPGGTLTVAGPTVAPWDHRRKSPDRPLAGGALFDLASEGTGWLAWSLNTVHPQAIWIQGVKLRFCRSLAGEVSATALLQFGYPPPDGSRWDHELARWLPSDPLMATLDFALAKIRALKDPKAAPPAVLWPAGAKAAPAVRP
jgi:hypothetical protein